MKILVTGSAGFIGMHLVREFLELGYSVTGLDNINDYYDTTLKYERLRLTGIHKDDIYENQFVKSREFKNYEFIKLNIEDQIALFKLFEDQKFDVVCHLAAQAGVRYSIENPDVYIQSNVVGFANVLEACRRAEIKHLIYASSSSVYGLNNDVPFVETNMVDKPVSLYAATKKSNELLAHSYSHLFKLKTTGLRFFTVYGALGRPDMFYYLLIDAISKQKTIKIFNNGDMKRDFTYIDDIVQGIVKVAIHENKERDLYKIYNIGNSKPINLLDFIDNLEEAMGVKANKEFVKMQMGDVYSTFADISEIQKDYMYKPSTDVKEGLLKFVNWFKEYNEN